MSVRPNHSNRENWGECILNLFYKHLGEPIWGSSYIVPNHSQLIQVMAFDDVFGGCRAFCSFGLSNYAELLGEVSEVILPVTTGWEASPEILIFALTQIITRVEKIGWGITVQFREEFPDFVKDYQKVALYLALPSNFPEDFRQIRCDDKLGQLYHAFFLTEAEYQFKLREGASGLEDTLQKCGPDVFDLSRKSCL